MMKSRVYKMELLLLGLLLLVVAGCRRDTDAPEAGETGVQAPEAAETAPAMPEASEVDAETPVFDQETHEETIRTLAPAHHARLAEVAQARATLAAYEADARRATPERETLADAMDAIDEGFIAQQEILASVFGEDEDWLRLQAASEEASAEAAARRDALAARVEPDPESMVQDTAVQEDIDSLRTIALLARERREAVAARERELISLHPEAQAAAEAIDRKREARAELEMRLQDTFKEDEQWQALQAEVEAADQRREITRQEIVESIRDRMRHDAARHRREREAKPAEDAE